MPYLHLIERCCGLFLLQSASDDGSQKGITKLRRLVAVRDCTSVVKLAKQKSGSDGCVEVGKRRRGCNGGALEEGGRTEQEPE